MWFFSRKQSRDVIRDRQMRDEMDFHVEMETEELQRFGMSRDEAKRQALASFGGVRRYTEEAHDARRGSWREDLVRDVRYSVRSLARTPGYAVVVILTLALGIAANTSIFSVANGVLFKRLPYRDPSRLMVLLDGLDWMGISEAWVTGPEIVRLRKSLTLFEGFSAMRPGSATIGGEQGIEPRQVPQTAVSSNFFQVLGAGPDIGRGFATGDDAPGAPRVAIISHRLFTERFGANRALVGRSILLDGAATTVVGVLPASFRFAPQSSLASPAAESDVYTPMTDTLDRLPPDNHSFSVLARVRDSVSPRVALAQLTQLSSRLDEEDYGKKGFKFVPIILQERVVREVRPALFALLGAVGVLILIMCANLAVLALVRTARRDHELTVRRAIGASRGRVTRQILTETLVLSLTGAVVGTLLGVWGLRALLALAPTGLPRRDEIGIDLTVLGVTLIVAIVVGLGMGLAPAFRATRGDIADVLRERASSFAGSRVRSVLVLAQVALSMMLLAGTGLLLSSFVRLMRVDPGFDPNRVLTIDMLASRSRYAAGTPVVDVYARYVAAIRAVPGVVSVAVTGAPPLSGGSDQSGVRFPSSPTNVGNPQHDRILADNAPISAGYLKTMGVALLAGREFDGSESDTTSAKVAVIDDLLAKRYFPNGPAVGQTLMLDGTPLRVIGVAKHFRMYDFEGVGREQLWVPHMWRPYRGMVIVARTVRNPLDVADAVRRAIRSVDLQQAIPKVGTMEQVVSESFASRRLVLTLVGAFAGAALLLVALGLYGVTANSVAQRTRELGIRVALGADRRRVIGSVIGQPTRLIAIGLVLGLAGTWVVGRIVQRLLYDTDAGDPGTLVAVSLVLLIVGALASYIPARRAAGADPMVALRAE